MTLSLFDACRKRRLTQLFSIVIFSVALFYAAVCMPVYWLASSNILLLESAFFIIWDGVATIVSYLFYWTAFAFMLYFASRFTLKNSKALLGVYLGASTFLYGSTLISYCLVNGFSDFAVKDLLDILIYVSIDAVIMALAVLIAWRILKPMQDRAKRTYLQQLSQDPDAELKMPKWLPFVRLFDFKNELMRCAFFASSVSAGYHIISRIGYDIFFGAPGNTVDLLWMIFAYVSEIVALFVGYFVMLLILNQLDMKEEEKQINYRK